MAKAATITRAMYKQLFNEFPKNELLALIDALRIPLRVGFTTRVMAGLIADAYEDGQVLKKQYDKLDETHKAVLSVVANWQSRPITSWMLSKVIKAVQIPLNGGYRDYEDEAETVLFDLVKKGLLLPAEWSPEYANVMKASPYWRPKVSFDVFMPHALASAIEPYSPAPKDSKAHFSRCNERNLTGVLPTKVLRRLVLVHEIALKAKKQFVGYETLSAGAYKVLPDHESRSLMERVPGPLIWFRVAEKIGILVRRDEINLHCWAPAIPGNDIVADPMPYLKSMANALLDPDTGRHLEPLMGGLNIIRDRELNRRLVSSITTIVKKFVNSFDMDGKGLAYTVQDIVDDFLASNWERLVEEVFSRSKEGGRLAEMMSWAADAAQWILHILQCSGMVAADSFFDGGSHYWRPTVLGRWVFDESDEPFEPWKNSCRWENDNVLILPNDIELADLAALKLGPLSKHVKGRPGKSRHLRLSDKVLEDAMSAVSADFVISVLESLAGNVPSLLAKKVLEADRPRQGLRVWRGAELVETEPGSPSAEKLASLGFEEVSPGTFLILSGFDVEEHLAGKNHEILYYRYDVKADCKIHAYVPPYLTISKSSAKDLRLRRAFEKLGLETRSLPEKVDIGKLEIPERTNFKQARQYLKTLLIHPMPSWLNVMLASKTDGIDAPEIEELMLVRFPNEFASGIIRLLDTEGLECMFVEPMGSQARAPQTCIALPARNIGKLEKSLSELGIPFPIEHSQLHHAAKRKQSLNELKKAMAELSEVKDD